MSKLHPTGLEKLQLQLRTVPEGVPEPVAADQWEISADGGRTWVRAVDEDGWSTWYFAGTEAEVPVGVPAIVLEDGTHYLVVRTFDPPEAIVRDVPAPSSPITVSR